MVSRGGHDRLAFRLAGLIAVVLVVMGAVLAVVAVVRQPPHKPLVVFVGDSYTAGSIEDSGYARRFPALVADALDVRTEVVAQGGSGYITSGINGKPWSDQIEAVPTDADLVVIYGSRNDSFDGSHSSEIQASAEALFRSAKEQAPNAKIVVVGPTYVESPIPAGAIATTDAIQLAAHDQDVEYVDALSWFQHPRPGLIGGDGVHPTDAGHAFLAHKFERIVGDALG
jgi:lysophospholipase L1-like esterase